MAKLKMGQLSAALANDPLLKHAELLERVSGAVFFPKLMCEQFTALARANQFDASAFQSIVGPLNDFLEATKADGGLGAATRAIGGLLEQHQQFEKIEKALAGPVAPVWKQLDAPGGDAEAFKHWASVTLPEAKRPDLSKEEVDADELEWSLSGRLDAAQRVEVHDWIENYREKFARRCDELVDRHVVAVALGFERPVGAKADDVVLRVRCTCGNERTVAAWPSLVRGGGGTA